MDIPSQEKSFLVDNVEIPKEN